MSSCVHDAFSSFYYKQRWPRDESNRQENTSTLVQFQSKALNKIFKKYVKKSEFTLYKTVKKFCNNPFELNMLFFQCKRFFNSLPG